MAKSNLALVSPPAALLKRGSVDTRVSGKVIVQYSVRKQDAASPIGVYFTGKAHRGSDSGNTVSKGISCAMQRSWLLEFTQSIDSFAALPIGWDSYDSQPPNAWCRSSAKEILGCCHELNLKPSSVTPTAEGGIAIAFVCNGRYGDIEVLNCTEILAVTAIPGTPSTVWSVGASEPQIKDSLSQIWSFVSA